MIVKLSNSNRKDKKYMVIVDDKKIHFGQKGYDDYILSQGNDDKKRMYIKRHKVRENWTKSGIKTAGFWSYHLLWNKKTLDDSIKDVERKYNIKIIKI